MISRRAMKGFISSFLCILAGAIIFLGTSAEGFKVDASNQPINPPIAILTTVGLWLIALGVLINFISLLL